MNNEEKSIMLAKAGWHTWYNPEYWVHPKVVADPNSQDYTSYGMGLEEAYEFETQNIAPVPLPKYTFSGNPIHA
jgi:hypothetical protein